MLCISDSSVIRRKKSIICVYSLHLQKVLSRRPHVLEEDVADQVGKLIIKHFIYDAGTI